MNDSFLWVESYRPQSIKDCILPARIKKTFAEFVNKGEIPNLLLSGPPGIGKTTIAKALCNELGIHAYVINGSDEGRFLDTVRNKAKQFASTRSLSSSAKHKVIIIDEADNTGNDVQLLLRANIETFHKTCRFIFTCNYKNKIIEPIHSRCSSIDFQFSQKEKDKLVVEFFKRSKTILDENLITYDEKVLASILKKHFPDWRRALNELQRYSASGELDKDALLDSKTASLDELIGFLSTKSFSSVRKWIIENSDNNPDALIRSVYDAMHEHLQPQSVPMAVIIIAKYAYQSAFVADQEINLLACLTEIMSDCEFK